VPRAYHLDVDWALICPSAILLTSGGKGAIRVWPFWGLPAFATMADDTGLDDQILDDEIFIALEG